MPLRRTLAALAALSLALIAGAPRAAERVQGSGRIQSQLRPASGFDAIHLRGSIKLVLRQGASERVEVRADDNLLPMIETRVVADDGGATLEIGPVPQADWSSRQEVQVTVDVARLKALRVDGSGDVRCEALKTPALALELRGSGDLSLRQLDTDDLRIRVAGSGDVDTRGRVRQLAVAVVGSGDVHAHELVAETASVSIAGSGNASVNARQSLAVSIAGSGDVTYTGDAAPQTSIAGSGTVKRR